MRQFRRLAPWLLPLLLVGLLLAGPAQAARQFNGTSHSLQSAATIDLTSFKKLSVASWQWIDSDATADTWAFELGDGSTQANGTFFHDPKNGASSYYVAFTTNDPLNYNIATFPRPTADAWHHVVIEMDMSVNPNTIAAYVDGVSQVITYTRQENVTTNFFSSNVLNMMSRNNVSTYLKGRLAEVVIWGGLLLSQTNVNALYNSGSGTCATNVQGGSLVNYWQILGTASPEPPTVGAINLTVNGATSVAHPASISCAPSAPSAHAPKGQRVPRYPPRGR